MQLNLAFGKILKVNEDRKMIDYSGCGPNNFFN